MIKESSAVIVRKIWGGEKLETLKGFSKSTHEKVEPIGETLEIFEEHLPYLVKLIDTSDELSIQVHPGDEYARLHENSSGKTECWIILDALLGAGVYLGLKPNISKEILQNALNEKKLINEFLNFYPAKKGDFFFVPSGSIHAIGKDITLAEVQQNSGITYRVWDWNRLDSKGAERELHVAKSLDVINFDPTANTPDFFRMRENTLQVNGSRELCNHSDFHLFVFNLLIDEVYQKDLSSLDRPCSVMNLDGRIEINFLEVKSFSAVTLENEKQLSIKALESGSFLIVF